jgi:hypothetical protein
MIDRIIRNRLRAVAALVVDFEAEIDIPLLGRLDVIRDAFAADEFTLAAFVQTELGVNQVLVVLNQPVDSVVRSAAFFIGGERNDDVARRLESFALIADQIRYPDRGLSFVVGGTAPVVVLLCHKYCSC